MMVEVCDRCRKALPESKDDKGKGGIMDMFTGPPKTEARFCDKCQASYERWLSNGKN